MPASPTAAHPPSPLFELPGGPVDTVINWGLGVDSSAYIAEMLTDPPGVTI